MLRFVIGNKILALNNTYNKRLLWVNIGNNVQEALGIKPKRALRDRVKNLCSAICYCDVVFRLSTHDGFAKLLLVEFSSLAPALPDGPLHQWISSYFGRRQQHIVDMKSLKTCGIGRLQRLTHLLLLCHVGGKSANNDSIPRSSSDGINGGCGGCRCRPIVST